MPSRPRTMMPLSVSRTSLTDTRSAGFGCMRWPMIAAPPQKVTNRPLSAISLRYIPAFFGCCEPAPSVSVAASTHLVSITRQYESPGCAVRADQCLAPGGVEVAVVPGDVLLDHHGGGGMRRDVVDRLAAHDDDFAAVAQRGAVIGAAPHLLSPAVAGRGALTRRGASDAAAIELRSIAGMSPSIWRSTALANEL